VKSLGIDILPSGNNRASRTVELSGYLDAGAVSHLDERLRETIGAEIERLVIRMENLSYISSAGIGLLMAWAQRLRTRGGRVILIRPTGKIHKILHMLGFTRVLQIADSEEESASAP